MVTGKVSKVFTLDFDGKPGRRTMKKLGLKPHRSTPSGGFHVDFVHPGWPVTTVNGKSKRKLGSLYSGMDIRGDSGYACILGTSNGGRYERLHNPKPDSIDVLPTRVLKEPATDFLVSEIFTISKAGHQRERGLSWIRPTGLRL